MNATSNARSMHPAVRGAMPGALHATYATQLTGRIQDSGEKSSVGLPPQPVDKGAIALVERTRRVLAEVQTWQEARSRALDATGLKSFIDRSEWLLAHPVIEFEHWRLMEATAEARSWHRNGSIAVPKRRPRVEFTDRQIEIAIAALGKVAA